MRILESAGQAESYIMHYDVNQPWPLDINVISKSKSKSALLSILPHVPYIHTEN